LARHGPHGTRQGEHAVDERENTEKKDERGDRDARQHHRHNAEEDRQRATERENPPVARENQHGSPPAPGARRGCETSRCTTYARTASVTPHPYVAAYRLPHPPSRRHERPGNPLPCIAPSPISSSPPPTSRI